MRYRTLWLSDLHLGTRGCQADALLRFLRYNDADTIYLNGDIIDGWSLRRKFYWPANHNVIVQKLLRKARRGTRIVYVTGNHDEFLRSFSDHDFGGIELTDEAIHVTADGRRLLVVHGDRFDVSTCYTWLTLLGDYSYTLMLSVNRQLMVIRRWCGLGHWSLSAYLKHKVKQAVMFISNYEHSIAQECKRRGFDGIVCGHIHQAEIRTIDGILYCNSGDWVESFTALAEDFTGNISIIYWQPCTANSLS